MSTCLYTSISPSASLSIYMCQPNTPCPKPDLAGELSQRASCASEESKQCFNGRHPYMAIVAKQSICVAAQSLPLPPGAFTKTPTIKLLQIHIISFFLDTASLLLRGDYFPSFHLLAPLCPGSPPLCFRRVRRQTTCFGSILPQMI